MSEIINIIYQDNDIIAVNKPAGMTVHKVQGYKVHKEGEAFLTDLLVENFPEVKEVGDEPELRPGIVHRLDKETSGVLLIARNQKAFEYLKSLFQQKEIIKKYVVLVVGDLKQEKGVIDLPIGRSRSDFRKKLASAEAKGELREAVTEYRVIERFSGKNEFSDKVNLYTLAEAYPKTGRTHQIRAHFKAIGHPVVCDFLYGGKKPICPFGLSRHFLHANFLEFTTPGGIRLKLEADLPEDLRKALEGLRKNK
ncbi:RluA family pseudouridine synthase [Candidatus Parcubacteria bacterium]|nr:MAG: RluA family pseudouridine synthase [Candidatus Parcubacteria bacterium]